MITEKELIREGFKKTGDTTYSVYIGGPWYLHAILSDVYDDVMLQYGKENLYMSDQVSIWATFKDITKLRLLIELLKGDKS